MAVVVLGMTGCTVLTDVDSLRTTGKDASVDSGSDASTAPYCAGQSAPPSFCDDFDKGTLGGTWDKTTVTGGQLDGVMGLSAPTALHTAVFGPAAMNTEANLNKKLAMTASVIDAGYDLWVEKRPSVEYLEVNDVGVIAGADTFYVGLALGPTDQWFSEHDSMGMQQYVPSPIAAALPTMQWTRIEWHLDLVNAKATLTIGGKMAFDGTLPNGFKPGTPFFVAGISYASKTADGGDLRIDNFVVRASP